MERPLSPFMFPTWYRFQITSVLSILHRLTGIALTVGSILVAGRGGGRRRRVCRDARLHRLADRGVAVVRLVGGVFLSPVQRHPAPGLGFGLRLRYPRPLLQWVSGA